MGEVRVWRATPYEADAVAELMIAFRNHLGRDWPSDNAFLASVEKLLERPDTDFLLATTEGHRRPLGVCQLRFRYGIWLAAEECHLEDLYVAEEARGAGLGRALVDAATERAIERRCRRMYLDVHEDNPAAWQLYESSGFRMKPPGERDVFVIKRLDDSP